MKRYSRIIAGALFFLTIFTLFFGVVQIVNAQPAGGTPTEPIPDGDLSTSGGYTGVKNSGGGKGILSYLFNEWRSWLANKFTGLLIWITGSFLWLGGKLLDASVQFNVCEMKSLMGTAVVSQGWLIARNIANFFFIFILLYIAISIILNVGENQKRLIVWVIIIALVINFSAVLTRFVIDVSNIFAYQFYSSIVGGGDPCTTESSNAKGISANYMTALDFQAYAAEATGDSSDKSLYQGTNGFSAIMVAGIMTAVFIMITAWSFIIVAALMIIRSAVLMILIVLSPIAFMGFILPQIKQVMTKWWGALISQAFFAPVYLFFAYITLILAKGTVALFSQETFASGSEQIFKIFLQYSILIALIVIGLVQAKKMSSAGAEAVQGRVLKSLDWMRGQATGAIGRQTAGRLGRSLADKTDSVTLRRLGEKMAEAKYGGSSSYNENIKAKLEIEKRKKSSGGKTGSLQSIGAPTRKQYFDSLSDREKSESLETLRKSNPKLAESLFNSMTSEQQEKVEKAGAEGKEAARKKEQSADIEAVIGNPNKKIIGLPKGSPERKERIEKIVKGFKDDEGRKVQKIIEDGDNADIDTLFTTMDPLDFVDLASKAKLTESARQKVRDGLERHENANPNSAIVLEASSNPKLATLFGRKKVIQKEGVRNRTQSSSNEARVNIASENIGEGPQSKQSYSL